MKMVQSLFPLPLSLSIQADHNSLTLTKGIVGARIYYGIYIHPYIFAKDFNI